ncbi:uncharacterized protein BYT42DRAFT_34974 [Radiomyces spectabilis]|uniref:uncharacterized protein n=1 Tax=Radiomyces spectabilis TaxID=64574 RepID=UPI00221F7983|nr:uncharacterized protein BYT42DRAFT_34974 [Radiomyces spectabilis]KAI8394213.1 hypothetical protein BYT42DRAFT_34974 [Radiomyces spectabilis]
MSTGTTRICPKHTCHLCERDFSSHYNLRRHTISIHIIPPREPDGSYPLEGITLVNDDLDLFPQYRLAEEPHPIARNSAELLSTLPSKQRKTSCSSATRPHRCIHRSDPSLLARRFFTFANPCKMQVCNGKDFSGWPCT